MENNIQCLTQACIQHDISFHISDDSGHVARVDIGPGLIFRNNVTPFNSEAMAKVCLDKSQTYALLHQQMRMPETLGFLDTDVEPKYQHYLHYATLPDIVAHIEQTLSYPVVIKMNRGSLGQQVYLCHDPIAITNALRIIFDKQTYPYDYLALAQEQIQLGQEFRVVFFRQKLLLCYERVAPNAAFGLRYWDMPQGHTKKITDPGILAEITQFVQPALQLPGLHYVGLDLIRDDQGDWCLLEMNSGPAYDHYIQFYGQDDIVALYANMLCMERERYS
ncbi:MAG: hypothetical protein AAFP10_06515 [Pseudomonadota bacterium]